MVKRKLLRGWTFLPNDQAYLADFHIIHSTQIGNIFPLKSIHFSKPILLIEIKYDVITKRRGIGLHKRGDGGSTCVAAASTRVGQLGTICRNWWLLLTPTKVMNGFLIPMCHVQPCASEDDHRAAVQTAEGVVNAGHSTKP